MPLPGVRLASMNRMSPPTGVQARPVATPGKLVRIASSLSNFSGRECVQVVGVDVHVLRAAFGDAHRDIAEHGADLALEIAHAGFARVVADDRHARVVGQFALLGL